MYRGPTDFSVSIMNRPWRKRIVTWMGRLHFDNSEVEQTPRLSPNHFIPHWSNRPAIMNQISKWTTRLLLFGNGSDRRAE